MATITLVNKSTQVIGADFLDQLGLKVDYGSKKINATDTYDLPTTQMVDTKGIVNFILNQPSNTRSSSSIHIDASLTTEEQTLEITGTATGKQLDSESTQSVVNSMNLKFTSDEFSNGTNTGGATGSAMLKLSANPFLEESDFRFLGESSKDQGFELSEGKRFNTSGTSSSTQDSLLKADGTIAGKVFALKESWREVQSDDTGIFWESSFDLRSKSGITYDQNLNFSGVFDSINISISNTRWSDSLQTLSFKGKTFGSAVTKAITDFAAGLITYEDVSAALLSGNNKITATSGRNEINGYDGNDALTGGSGEDIFHFSTALNAKTNFDTIKNFNVNQDRIALHKDIFTVFNNENLTEEDLNNHFIIDQKKGVVSYDADGLGTEYLPVAFVRIIGKIDFDQITVDTI